MLDAFLRTQHSTSTSGSNRRVPPPRGSSSPAHLGHSLSSASSRFGLSFLYEAFPHAEERRLRIRASYGSALPSSGPTSSFTAFVYAREVPVQGGGRMCFPVRDMPVSSQNRIAYCHRSCSARSAEPFCIPGRPDVFSWPRLRTTSSPLLHSSILLISSRSSCASMVWSDTAFRVGPGRSRTPSYVRSCRPICLRGGSHSMSNVSRGEMFEAIC